MYKITSSAAPTLKTATNASPLVAEFISLCLNKEPSGRPRASVLMIVRLLSSRPLLTAPSHCIAPLHLYWRARSPTRDAGAPGAHLFAHASRAAANTANGAGALCPAQLLQPDTPQVQSEEKSRDVSEERRRPASLREERKAREADTTNRVIMDLRKEIADLRSAQDLRFAMIESNVAALSSEVVFWKTRTQELEQRLKDKKEKKDKDRRRSVTVKPGT